MYLLSDACSVYYLVRELNTGIPRTLILRAHSPKKASKNSPQQTLDIYRQSHLVRRQFLVVCFPMFFYVKIRCNLALSKLKLQIW